MLLIICTVVLRSLRSAFAQQAGFVRISDFPDDRLYLALPSSDS